jgi:transcription antitermination factor NusG
MTDHLESGVGLHEGKGRSPLTPWHAVWTRSNCEQRVRDELDAKGFESFLPKARSWRWRAGERRRVEVPLFPGYLFVHHDLDKASYAEVLKAHGVVRVLGERWDRLAAIPPDEIEAIQRVMDAGLSVFPCAHLHAGDRVRITGGPLTGVQGTFVRGRPDRGLLVLTVELLQRSVAVEIDCTLVGVA